MKKLKLKNEYLIILVILFALAITGGKPVGRESSVSRGPCSILKDNIPYYEETGRTCSLFLTDKPFSEGMVSLEQADNIHSNSFCS